MESEFSGRRLSFCDHTFFVGDPALWVETIPVSADVV
jgi:hypothetical protein